MGGPVSYYASWELKWSYLLLCFCKARFISVLLSLQATSFGNFLHKHASSHCRLVFISFVWELNVACIVKVAFCLQFEMHFTEVKKLPQAISLTWNYWIPHYLQSESQCIHTWSKPVLSVGLFRPPLEISVEMKCTGLFWLSKAHFISFLILLPATNSGNFLYASTTCDLDHIWIHSIHSICFRIKAGKYCYTDFVLQFEMQVAKTK